MESKYFNVLISKSEKIVRWISFYGIPRKNTSNVEEELSSRK